MSLAYDSLIRGFALRWAQAGNFLPWDYDSPDAQPISASDRAYTSVRGPGDGRQPAPSFDFVIESASRDEAGLSGSTQASDSSSEDEWDVFEAPLHRQVATSTLASQGGEESFSPEITTQSLFLPNSKLLDVRLLQSASAAADCAAMLVCICVLSQPLVLAHADGFTVLGVHLNPSSRSLMLRAVQRLCASLFSASQLAFMVGEYSPRARLFTTAVDFHPPPRNVIRTPAQRALALARGAIFVWCTLDALRGAPAYDAAARSVLATRMFIEPAPTSDSTHLSSPFRSGVSPLRSVLTRPQPDSPSSPHFVLQRMLAADLLLRESILRDIAEGDLLLSDWAERITPFDIQSVPSHLLRNLRTFDDTRLDSVGLTPAPAPSSLVSYSITPATTPPPLRCSSVCEISAGASFT